MGNNNTLIIIQREFLNKVKKKSFLVLTILMPLLFVGIIFAPMLLSNMGNTSKTYIVVDKTGIYSDAFSDTKNVYVFAPDTTIAFDSLRNDKCKGVIFIEASALDSNHQTAQFFYATSEPSMEQLQNVSSGMTSALQQSLLENMAGITPEAYSVIKDTKVELSSLDVNTGEQTYSEVKTIIGYVFGFMIYMFIFMFGGQITSGVIEEKTNRIIEVMISSVKPMQLFMGKIIGIALVGLTQLLIWVLLTTLLVFIGGSLFGGSVDAESMAAAQKMAGAGSMVEPEMMTKVMDMINTVHLGRLFAIFMCYFIGGYLLYASLFAAIGAAVDNQEDTSQFMLPVTIPLILSILVSVNILNDPNGPIAFWFSIIPFTSPVAMMIRAPFGVETWEYVLSMSLLVLGFIGTTYMASKIYRVGILMYGKKPSYKELWKWIRYNN